MKTAGLNKKPARHTKAALASAVGLALLAGTAQAQQPAGDQQDTLVKLIRSLIDSGALKAEDGQQLLQEAQRSSGPAAAQAQPGDVRVPYVPQTVRDGIRDEVRQEVLAQAKAERWAAPEAVPEWVQRIHVSGDARVRNEWRLFSESNSNIEVDWGRVNDGSGYDVNPNTNLLLPPLLNTRMDRDDSWRIRARLGVTADLGEHAEAGIRLSTGNDDRASSQTQTLGGGLSKKNTWVDQAWITWQPVSWLRVIGGRFQNPFWSTETLFSNDLAFDGLAVKFATDANADYSLFATASVTPLEYSADNFPSTSTDKDESHDKWLHALQIGGELTFGGEQRLRGAVAYYDFDRVSGVVSAPCALYAGADYCSTDWSRPAAIQKGNTLMLLRNIALDPLDPANTQQPQYVGLASQFELLDVNLSWTLPAFAGNTLALEGNWIQNLAYDPQKLWNRAGGGIVSNLGTPSGDTPTADDIRSGDNAWQAQATFGKPKLGDAGDWNIWLGYRRIEPDAVLDAYNDSDFHLGGTNAKGYFLGGSWLFDQRLSLSGSWFAAKEVYGAPSSIDVFQLEVNARF